jgi:AraC-like DNA-binding protein
MRWLENAGQQQGEPMEIAQPVRRVSSAAVGGATRTELVELALRGRWDDANHQERFVVSSVLSSTGYGVERCYRDSPLNGFHPLGRTVASPSGLDFSHCYSQGRLRAICCYWEPTWVARLLGHAPAWDVRTLRATVDIVDTDIQHTLHLICTETVNPGFCADIVIDGLGRALLGHVARYLWGWQPRLPAERADSAQKVIARAKDYIEASLHLGLTTGRVARAVGMSRNHLMRQFKTATGATLHAYVEEMRTARAKALLATDALPIKEISFQTGFNSPSSFSAAFIRKTGLTPMDYRRRCGRQR